MRLGGGLSFWIVYLGVIELMAKLPSKKKFLQILGENIYRERNALHLSREYVSEKIGLSVAALAAAESGKVEITSTTLVRFAKAVGCRLEDLFRGLI